MLKSLLKDQVQKAFGILDQTDGLAPTGTFFRMVASTYDTATGRVINTETAYSDVPMVFASYKSEEIDDSEIVTTDQKVIIAANDLPVVPKVQDRVSDPSGEEYMIMDVKGVPGKSLWRLQVRKTE